MLKTKLKHQEKLKELLKKFSEVSWDRLIRDKNKIWFYGWIEREKDSYKDFILLKTKRGKLKNFFTSSPNIPENLLKDIFPKNIKTKMKQDVCERVEDLFDIQNSIKLKKIPNEQPKKT